MRYLGMCLLVALCLPSQSQGQERLSVRIDSPVASRNLESTRIASFGQPLLERDDSSLLYDFLRFNLVFGSGFVSYGAGGYGSGLAVHHLAPHSPSEAITPEEIAAFILGGSLSSALAIHLVEGREGNFAYTAGGALLSQVAVAGVAGSFFFSAWRADEGRRLRVVGHWRDTRYATCGTALCLLR